MRRRRESIDAPAPEQTVLGQMICVALAAGAGIKDVLVRSGEVVYVNGPLGLVPMNDCPPIETSDLEILAESLHPHWRDVMAQRAIDRPLSFLGTNLRCNLGWFDGGRGMSAVIRIIPYNPPALATLALPSVAENFVNARRGLILVVGATSAGKTTTLAGMIDYLNERNRGHIVTLEHPIEIKHGSKLSVVTQREVGEDVQTYSAGLQDAMRQAPYAILVGEIRNEETALATLEAVESGHLVLASMHASTAVGALTKLVTWSHGTEDTRAHALAQNLVGVVAQTLLPHAERKAWVPIYEVLPATDQVCAMIARREFDAMAKHLREGTLVHAISFDQALQQARLAGHITAHSAASFLAEPAQAYRVARQSPGADKGAHL